MLTVILPAGLGARDGILAIVLASAMPLSAGTAVALVSRFVVTLVDVLAAAGGWAYARRHHLVASRAELERRAETLVSDDPVADDPLIDESVAGVPAYRLRRRAAPARRCGGTGSRSS